MWVKAYIDDKTRQEISFPYKTNSDNSYHFWKLDSLTDCPFTNFSTITKGLKIHVHTKYPANEAGGTASNKPPVLRGLSITYRDKSLK